jgi:hypothetical protein
MQSTTERFKSKVKIVNGCWLWQDALYPDGYGVFHIDGKNYRAHRISFEFFVSKIPEGMCVCHRCDTPACVNPKHLFLGTNLENRLDCVAKGRQARGQQHGLSKLDEKQVKEIRCLREHGKTLAEIASQLNISSAMVSLIVNRKNWRHI